MSITVSSGAAQIEPGIEAAHNGGTGHDVAGETGLGGGLERPVVTGMIAEYARR
ncbi:hypothetical protein [Planomonospora parontospora]|uniref:hypothetical protein n=1 Tax=Planomonospora parontospora TaxID=58119 RepID=UPI0016713E41|nr:hypothetical protein [Planomonospora parontospora]GGL54939.1 hypothetical protein GCM10014719_65310 [Planomonospora parontospora subsp. antibiotica]GII19294.1 hypothetical protein Ppa05_60200 [Planomonospora parontospora subsp. antibiotica]